MKVLVVGGGGREHALVWKIAQSPFAPRIYAAPGNAGIAQLADCLPIPATDLDGLLAFARKEGIDLTVVGPELPLAQGIVDQFGGAGLTIFGPSQKAALLETSKVFAKEFMARFQIPTADYRVFDAPTQARRYVQQRAVPMVIKADGLAAGKGAIVAKTVAEAEAAIGLIMEERVFGPAGDVVVIEDFLEGEEASIMALVDGESHLTLAASQDHKAVYDGDRGPNTGGMGAYAPAAVVSEQVSAQVEECILRPAIRGMAQEGAPFKGVLYAGLMISPTGPRVVEFNCRFGDPETQVVLPLLRDDLLEMMLAACDGNLEGRRASWLDGAAVCVVMASGGYPGSYQRNFEIHGLTASYLQDIMLFHAGTKQVGRKVLTDGGRVLGVTALGESVDQAVRRVYRAVEKISFTGAHFRRDIAHRALRKFASAAEPERQLRDPKEAHQGR